jgi:alpha-N-arabinofuranosidase
MLRKVSLAVDPARVLGTIDERIYGHFLEHIYHSVNGGLWGEMVWDRSFEEPPGDDPRVAGGWRTFGRGWFERTADRPLNSEFCQHIVPARGEAGVQQSPFFVEKGHRYHGSLFVRGAASGLTVRLLDGRKVLAAARLGRVKGDWAERRFTLRPTATGENAVLRITAAAGGDLYLDQVSLMSDAARRAGGFRPDLLRAVRDLRPSTIRWPGGCFVQYYRWKDGIGPQHERGKYPARMWDDQDVNSLGTDEFISLCRRVGAEPVICVSVGLGAPRDRWDELIQDACDWVEYCNGSPRSRWGKVRAANGSPKPYGVKYWEVGNEVWDFKPRDYTVLLKRFCRALKTVDPSIRIISCGSGQLGARWPGGDRAVVRDCADIVDYHSVHHYEQPERFAEGPAAAERFLRRLGRRIAASANPDLKLYLSEWNGRSTDWRTGLYAAGLLNVLERNSALVPMACPALFLRHVSATGWDNALINFDHKAWYPAPNYVVMKLWRDHFAPHRVALDGRATPLNAIATASKDGSRLVCKLVNPTWREVSVTVTVPEAFPLRRAHLDLVAPGSPVMRNQLGDPERIVARPAPVERDGRRVRFRMPCASAGVAVLR